MVAMRLVMHLRHLLTCQHVTLCLPVLDHPLQVSKGTFLAALKDLHKRVTVLCLPLHAV
jgi:hypothetical protein